MSSVNLLHPVALNVTICESLGEASSLEDWTCSQKILRSLELWCFEHQKLLFHGKVNAECLFCRLYKFMKVTN